jgi:hypothetical protein
VRTEFCDNDVEADAILVKVLGCEVKAEWVGCYLVSANAWEVDVGYKREISDVGNID